MPLRMPTHQWGPVQSLGRERGGIYNAQADSANGMINAAVNEWEGWVQAESDAELAKTMAEMSVEGQRIQQETLSKQFYTQQELPAGTTFSKIMPDGRIPADEVQGQVIKQRMADLKEKYSKQLKWDRSRTELDKRFQQYDSKVQQKIIGNSFDKRHKRIVGETLQSVRTLADNATAATRSDTIDMITESINSAVNNGAMEPAAATRALDSALANVDYTIFQRTADELIDQVVEGQITSELAEIQIKAAAELIDDSNMTAAQKNAARDETKAAIRAFKNHDAAVLREHRQNQVNNNANMRVGIVKGQVTEADIEKAHIEGEINDVQRADRIIQLHNQNKANLKAAQEQAQAIALVSDPAFSADPRSATHKKAVDIHFEQVAAPAIASLPPEDQPLAIEQYVRQKGIIPSSVKSRLRGALRAGPNRDQENPEADANRKVIAAELINRIQNNTPAAVEDDFRQDDIDKAIDIATQINAGADPIDAVRRVEELHQVDNRVIQTRKDIASRDDHFEKNVAFINKEILVSGWFSLDPPMNDALLTEFNALQEMAFLRTGSFDSSQQIAAAIIKKTWAYTGVGGPNRMMKYAPERYGPAGMDLPDQTEWMEQQFRKDVSGLEYVSSPEAGPIEFRISADPITANEARNGIPSYRVSVMIDGSWRDVVDADGEKMRWKPDWNSSDKKKEIDEAEAAKDKAARTLRPSALETKSEARNILQSDNPFEGVVRQDENKEGMGPDTENFFRGLFN